MLIARPRLNRWCPRLPASFVLLIVVTASGLVAEELVPGYEWIELRDDVFVVTRADPFAGPVDGNSTVMVNDRDVVVVDSHIDPAVARAVIARIRKLTPNPVSFLINTHWHDDHTNGNQAYRDAFPGIEIVSHPATLEALHEKWPQFLEDRRTSYGRVADRDLHAMADDIEATDPARAFDLRMFAGYRDALLPELDTLEAVYPTLVAEQLTFVRASRTIEVRWLGRGNTEGDLVVWLPGEKILITGDLVVHPIPYAFDARMKDWITTLHRLLDLGAETLVPGHGRPLPETRYVGQLIRLLEETLRVAGSAKARGETLEQALEQQLLESSAETFAGDDPVRRFSWESFYHRPGLESAWNETP